MTDISSDDNTILDKWVTVEGRVGKTEVENLLKLLGDFKSKGFSVVVIIDDGNDGMITANCNFDAGLLRIIERATDSLRTNIKGKRV